MESRSGDPPDRIERWLDHVAEEGRASMLPERAFPVLDLGYTVWLGRSKYKLQHLLIRLLMYSRLSVSGDRPAGRPALLAAGCRGMRGHGPHAGVIRRYASGEC